MQAVAEKPGKLVLHPGWIAFAAIALAVPMGALLLRQSVAPDLPMLGDLPAFSLIAENGKPFGKEDLLGRSSGKQTVCPACSPEAGGNRFGFVTTPRPHCFCGLESTKRFSGLHPEQVPSLS